MGSSTACVGFGRSVYKASVVLICSCRVQAPVRIRSDYLFNLIDWLGSKYIGDRYSSLSKRNKVAREMRYRSEVLLFESGSPEALLTDHTA